MLTGISLNKTYTQLGEMIWAAVLKDENTKGKAQWFDMILRLHDLPENASEKQIERALNKPMIKKARYLARVWYTGKIINKDKSESVLFYDDALVWRACDWTKPPATCGGKFGYWAKPFVGKG